MPLLAQAILEARSVAREVPDGAAPLAVVAAPRISDPAVAELKDFCLRHARDAAIGVIDLEGLRAFVGPARNASQLASAAHVSIMSAFRFLRQPARWIIRGDPQRQLSEALRSLPSRACLGLFAAADALGFGFVHGVPPHIYVEDLGPSGLRQMGLSAEVSGQPDVLLRLPSAPEAVFRGAVRKAGVQACDVIQMWLDVSAHPARGHEQAALVHRRILQPLLKHRRTTT